MFYLFGKHFVGPGESSGGNSEWITSGFMAMDTI
jgi:hypothetical protein